MFKELPKELFDLPETVVLYKGVTFLVVRVGS